MDIIMEKENTVKPQSSLEKYVKKHPNIADAIAYQCGGTNIEWMCTMQDLAEAEEEDKKNGSNIKVEMALEGK